MLAEIDAADLPGQARDLAGVIGLAGATKLCAKYGGVRLYVPQTIAPEHALVALLGEEAAAKLSRHYGREMIEVPRCIEAIRRARNRALVRDARAGMSQRQLALKYELTERAVRLIWRHAGILADDRQGALF